MNSSLLPTIPIRPTNALAVKKLPTAHISPMSLTHQHTNLLRGPASLSKALVEMCLNSKGHYDKVNMEVHQSSHFLPIRKAGIEPTLEESKSSILPLYYFLVGSAKQAIGPIPRK